MPMLLLRPATFHTNAKSLPQVRRVQLMPYARPVKPELFGAKQSRPGTLDSSRQAVSLP